jgi:hypothetical protein
MIGLSLALLAVTAFAPQPIRFTGATWGLSAFGGPVFLNDDRVQGRLGFAAGFSGRFTSALFLADLELSYGVSRVAGTANSVALDLRRHGLCVTLALHPFFLRTLGNRWMDYLQGAFHLDIGASLEVSSVSLGGEQRSRGDPAWHWGAGLEFPVTNPNTGRSLWIGVRFRQIRVSSDIVRAFATDLGDSQVLITLGYRWNWK